ncbi:MAG: DUF1559 domain-containing protein [Verrucomicrobiota bacterium]|nr:DUF1559 domain-containing protein [Verrucomicrobiota bacterium]
MKSEHPTSAFTLVELLVVIAVIAVLAALLFPAVTRIQDQAKEMKCANNLRQLATAFLNFAAEHDGSLPGAVYDRANVDPDTCDWLFGPSTNFADAPQRGTVFPYVKGEAKLYRCPSLPEAEFRSGLGSNGRFDYAFSQSFPGAKLANLKGESRFTDVSGKITVLPTPMLLEEDPAFHINGKAIEGGHGSIDKMSHTHRGGGYYASTTGSVHWFEEPAYGNTFFWTSEAPSGKWISLGQSAKYGWWNTQ